MATIADVLRAAALRVEQGTAVTARGAIYLAIGGSPQGFQPGQPFDTHLYEQARDALVARLPYPPGRNPERLLRRWSQATSRADMAREMRAAALAATPQPVKKRACWCADPGRTVAEMYQCPSGDAGEECLAHDYLAVGSALGYGLDPRMPIPDLTEFRDAVVAAEAEQERAR